ncbi:MAG: hypothetical protein WBB07_22585 [Mycobacterium sp.]
MAVVHEADEAKYQRLTHKSAAVALGFALLAIPVVPQIIDVALPEREWATDGAADDGDGVVDLFTTAGTAIEVSVPDDWIPENNGDSATLHGPNQMIMIQVYDRAGRDTDIVTDRLMRANRISGINSAFDGGRVEAADGALSGKTCVAILEGMSGTCAYLANDNLVVEMMALSNIEDGGEPAPSMAEVAPLIVTVSE